MVNTNITGELAKVAGLVARAHPDCAVQIIYEDGLAEDLWLLRADNGVEAVAEYIVNDETGETEPALPDRVTGPSFPITAAQAQALADWSYPGPDPAVIQLTSQNDGSLYAVQGDEHVLIDRNGEETPLEIRHA